MKQFLFLTTTNLAANPRLTKELHLAIGRGIACTVVQFHLGNWSDKMTEQLQREFPSVSFIHLSALRKPFVHWLISSLLEKVTRILPVMFATGSFLSGAIDKRSWIIMNDLNKLGHSYDWVIAHNPGAFYPAMILARQTGANLGIDIEDYHPGETNDKKMQAFTLRLMRHVLPCAAYTSFASSLIMQQVKKEVCFHNNYQLTVLNSFYKNEFILLGKNPSGPLRLIWFSQFVDRGRGLESVLSVIEHVHDIQLHLVGNIAETFREQFIRGKVNVFCHEPMKQKDLHSFLSEFDIGLALEPGRDLNNQLAVSNKMMAYAQSGLFIIASHTPAQDDFLANSNLEYLQTDLKEDALKRTLQELVTQKERIRSTRNIRFSAGRKYDWENISEHLSTMWDS
jgi:glycosyltransferase involved in cell wall biosynthesis